MYRLKDFSNSFAEQYPEFNLTKKDSEHFTASKSWKDNIQD